MKTTDTIRLAVISGVLVFSCCAGAAVYYVDGANPAAKDDNPGTEAAPFKTIQAGLNVALKPNDVVRVRAGVYRESAKFAASGDGRGNANYNYWSANDPARYITLEADGDHRVILDGSAEIPADKWTLLEGHKNVYVADYPGPCRNQIYAVFVDDKMIAPAFVKNPKNEPTRPLIGGMPADDAKAPGFHHDVENKKLYVSLAGKTPGKDAKVEPIVHETGVNLDRHGVIRVRKIEFRRFNSSGIAIGGSNDPVIEDCHIHHCGQGIAAWGLVSGQIRRNVMSHLFANGISMTGARAVTVDNNVIRVFNLNPYRIGNTYVSSINMVGGDVLGNVIRNNVITDLMSHSAGGGGPWPDCGGASLLLYGNSVFRVGMGFYIEAVTFGCLLQWNTVYDNVDGIVVRAASGNIIMENYVLRNRRMSLAAGSLFDGHPDALYSHKGNTFIYNWVIDNRGAVSPTPSPDKKLICIFDHNTYKLLDDKSLLLNFDGKRYSDLETIQRELKTEINSKVVKEFDANKTCGLVTFRLAEAQKPWEAIPMFGNPDMSRYDPLTSKRTYFWRRGTFLEEKWTFSADAKRKDGRWPANSWSFTWPGTKAYAILASGDGKETKKSNDEAHYLEAGSIDDDVPATAEGYGYWSAALPTLDDAVIDVSMFVRAENVKAASPGGGVYAFVEFRDERGQNAKREFLIGGPDGQKGANEKLQAGTFEHTEAKAAITAPKGARWMQLAFGVRNATGKAQFDTVNIHTRPGQEQEPTMPDPMGQFPPVKTMIVERPKAIDPANFKWQGVSLVGLLNRALIDEASDDGKGGWFDLGPQADMRNLQPGPGPFAGVPFNIEKDKAVFIAKSRFRKSDDLPDGGKIDIKAKGDVLAFLHTGGWMGEVGVKHATYVIHYADGTSAEIPIVAGKNNFDWIAPPEVADEVKYDEKLGFAMHGGTVNTSTFPTVHLWVLLWKNPHPQKEIVAFVVKGVNEGIVALLGLAAGTNGQ